MAISLSATHEPLRIALIYYRMMAPVVYGIGIRIQEVLKRLPSDHIRVDVFASHDGPNECTSYGPGVRLHRIGHPLEHPEEDSQQRALANSQHFASALGPHLDAARFNILHFHHWQSAYMLQTRNQPLTGEPAIVYTPHLLGRAKKTYWSSSIREDILKCEEAVLSLADVVISLSQAEQRDLETFYGVDRRKIRIVPNGFDHVPAGKVRTAPTDRSVRLVSIGRIARQKNWLFHLDVMRLARMKNVPWHLTLVGGQYEDSYEGELLGFINRNQLHSSVSLTGYVNPVQIPELLRESDVYLHAADYESQGIAIGEAMRSGLPCVIRDAKGPRDFFCDQRHGYLVTTPEEAVERIQILQESPHRYNDLSRAGLAASGANNWSSTVGRLVMLYHEITSGKRFVQPEDVNGMARN